MTHPLSSAAPIGVFDSGVGGLSVLTELRRALPHENFIYLADTAHLPYGTREDDDIRQLTARAVTALHGQGVKAVVVACNTASAFSLDHLRSHFALPIIGLVPAVKPALKATRTGVVGVLATPSTMRGSLLQTVIREYAEPTGIQVVKAASPELVPLIETGQANSPRTRAVLRDILTPIAEAGGDQLVLGCTHYPFLSGSIRAEFGDQFALVDSGAAVARHTRNVLEQSGLLTEVPQPGEVRYLVTGEVEAARPQLTMLSGGSAGLFAAPSPLDIAAIQT